MVASQFATPPELIALTSSMMICVRSLGGSIGLAINNAVIHNALDKELAKKIAAATLPLGLPSSSIPEIVQALASQNRQAVAAVPGITPQIAQAAVRGMKRAYVIAFRNSWIVSAAFCAILLIGKFSSKFDETISDDKQHVCSSKSKQTSSTSVSMHLLRVVLKASKMKKRSVKQL